MKLTKMKVLSLLTDWESDTSIAVALRLQARQDPARITSLLWRLEREGLADFRKHDASGRFQFRKNRAGRAALLKADT